MPVDEGRTEGQAPVGFGPAKKYERHGSGRHKSGRQERHAVERPDTFEGGHIASLAPEGSIPIASLAERLNKRVAEHRED
jgi:hypothetical protein